MSRAIGNALLRWYRTARRDLPWRATRDPYAIWISEVMLQQTRVGAVIPYYERFLARFPDWESLARAPLDAVLAAWSGLGYYRRARMLHEAARQVAREGVPRTVEGWRALPGVGAYTAAAVASIAFGVPAAVVDGNVERVVCRRLAAARGAVDPGEVAGRWLVREHPGDFNQAVMELGATVCLPASPRCGDCPIRRGCRGRASPDLYPGPKRRAAPRAEERDLVVSIEKGRAFLVRSKGPGPMRGMWELPEGSGRLVATLRHSIMDRRISIRLHLGGAAGPGRRFTPEEAAGLPLGAAARKCLRRIGFLSR